MMSTNTRTGLTNAETCKTYAEMLLWKNNINYELCDATCLLNSNYTVGLPIFIERQLAVWYVGRVTHTFTSGSGCTTILTLTYKRTPMCLKKDIKQYINDNLNWGKLNQTEYDYIKKYEDFLSWGYLNTDLTRTFPIAKGVEAQEGNLLGEIVPIEGTNQAIHKEDYMFVWTPVPDALYLLTLELQQQIDIVNNGQNNKGKTSTNNQIKSKETLYVFGAEGSETVFTEETYLTETDRLKAAMAKQKIEKSIRKEIGVSAPLVGQTQRVAKGLYETIGNGIVKATNNVVVSIKKEPILNKLKNAFVDSYLK